MDAQAAWVANLTEHGAPASDCSIVTLGANAEQETILVGLDTGALFCIQATADACSSIEEVHVWVTVLTLTNPFRLLKWSACNRLASAD